MSKIDVQDQELLSFDLKNNIYLEKYIFKEFIQGTSFSLTNANSTNWIWPQWYNTNIKEWSFIDTLLIYTLCYELSNDVDTQSSFVKNFDPWNHSYLLKYALLDVART